MTGTSKPFNGKNFIQRARPFTPRESSKSTYISINVDKSDDTNSFLPRESVSNSSHASVIQTNSVALRTGRISAPHIPDPAADDLTRNQCDPRSHLVPLLLALSISCGILKCLPYEMISVLVWCHLLCSSF